MSWYRLQSSKVIKKTPKPISENMLGAWFRKPVEDSDYDNHYVYQYITWPKNRKQPKKRDWVIYYPNIQQQHCRQLKIGLNQVFLGVLAK